jgi:hypothetical protein
VHQDPPPLPDNPHPIGRLAPLILLGLPTLTAGVSLIASLLGIGSYEQNFAIGAMIFMPIALVWLIWAALRYDAKG